MKDSYGRNIDYMRISVTESCNLHCNYCMPRNIKMTPSTDILTFEEILNIVKAAVAIGINKFRITGGEPLVRNDCVELVRMIKEIPGVIELGMTTNGTMLEKYAKSLKNAGLGSINVSVDTLDTFVFKKIAGNDMLLNVLDGIKTAKEEGLNVKINTVNHKKLDAFSILEYGSSMNIPVRFIEIMPIGNGIKYMGNSNEELLRTIEEKYGPIVEADTDKMVYGSGPARYYRFSKLNEPVGFISALHNRFCHECNRIRLTSKGQLKLCLCYEDGVDLKRILRSNSYNDSIELQKEIISAMEKAIMNKPRQHCFENIQNITEKHLMANIGG